MGFELRAYSEIKEELNNQIMTLRAKHSAGKVEELPDHRRIQVQFLNAAIDELDINDVSLDQDNDNARTLTGLMHIVYAEIRDTSGSGSLFRKGLHAAMGVDKDNVIDPNSELAMLQAAKDLYVSLVFTGGKTTGKLLEDHAFSTVKGFDQEAFEGRMTDMIHAAERKVFAEAHSNQRKELREREEEARKLEGGSKGWLSSVGGMFGGSKKSTDEAEEYKAPSYNG